LLLYLLSDDIDIDKTIDIYINPESKKLYVKQKKKERISWKYDVDHISKMREEKGSVGTTLELIEELS